MCNENFEETKQHYQIDCRKTMDLKKELKQLLLKAGKYTPQNQDEWNLFYYKGKKYTSPGQTTIIIAEAFSAQWEERTKTVYQTSQVQQYKYEQSRVWDSWKINLRTLLQKLQNKKPDPNFNKKWKGIAKLENKRVKILYQFRQTNMEIIQEDTTISNTNWF